MLNTYKLPTHFYITSGIGVDSDALVSFDKALIDANISNYNLLKISSILPPNCIQSKSISKEFGSPLLTAYGTLSSSKVGTVISSAIAVGIPRKHTDVGVIMEESSFESSILLEKRVCNMVKKAMQNHQIELSNIISSSAECVVKHDGTFATTISAIVLF